MKKGGLNLDTQTKETNQCHLSYKTLSQVVMI